MIDYDRSNFIDLLKKFPVQPGACSRFVKKTSIDTDKADVQNIVIAGMGGSAISGDLLAGYIQNELNVPLYVHRDYSVPAFVNERTLLIAVSYSGNTEETISAVEEGLQKGALITGISSGGELENICKVNKKPHIKIPSGYPPRQALGYLFFSLLHLFEKLDLISDQSENIRETVEVLNDLAVRYDPFQHSGNHLANHIAQSIYHAIPVIYTGCPHLAAVTVRWRNQFNENSKVMAFSNVFPELNHNEIMGWEGDKDVNKHFRVILLHDPEENPRIQERISVTKEILRTNHILFGEIFPEGKSRLARMFSLIYTGDWASYYLAMLNEKDPITIGSIDYLKKKLAEVAQ